jgi:hypothetical protein
MKTNQEYKLGEFIDHTLQKKDANQENNGIKKLIIAKLAIIKRRPIRPLGSIYGDS